MSFDHIGIHVPAEKHQQCLAFYLAALKPIGFTKRMVEGPNGEAVGFGDKSADWWVSTNHKTPEAASAPVHVAFRVQDRKTVDEFHAAGLAAGGKDNGAPGVRAHYNPNYYAAFLLDPVGNNIEVVSHKPE